MPNLQNSYIYKDWILDVSRAREGAAWSTFNLYHQCEHGTIRRAKGLLKNPDLDDFSHFHPVCTGCQVDILDDVLQQMRAMWNLLSRASSEH